MTKKTFKQSEKNDKFRGIFPFEFDDKGGESTAIPEKIHLVPIGQWEHDLYGPIIINNADIREFIQNFNAGVRKGVFITAGHEGFQELPAVGWIKEVEGRDDGLWGLVDWNSTGEKSLKEKEFKFFSPEMCRDYEDPQTHQYYRNVLTGGALTKSPYFKELQAIVFSDKNIKSNLNNKQTMTKTLDEVLALEVDALTDEDKAVLEENNATLTDEQKTKYGITVEAPAPADAPAETPAPEATPETPVAPVETPAVAPTNETIEASEKGKPNVTISASEFAIMKNDAEKGKQAFAELEKQEVNKMLAGFLFSESNKVGKFLPKSKDNLRAFIEKMSKDQREVFSSLVAQMPELTAFKEIGGNDIVEGKTAFAEVNAKIDAKIKASDGKLSYADAMKAVFAENSELEKRYNEEL